MLVPVIGAEVLKGGLFILGLYLETGVLAVSDGQDGIVRTGLLVDLVDRLPGYVLVTAHVQKHVLEALLWLLRW